MEAQLERLEPLAVDIPTFARLVSLPVARCYTLALDGRIPVVKFRRSVRVPLAAAEEWLTTSAKAEQARRQALKNGGAGVEEPAPAPPPVEEERTGGWTRPPREPIPERTVVEAAPTEMSEPLTRSGL